MYNFHDQRVDQVQVNDFMEQAKEWRVEGASENQMHVNDATQRTMGWRAEETIEV